MELLKRFYRQLGTQKARAEWDQPFVMLRRKWHEVPAGNDRVLTRQLMEMEDAELLHLWSRLRLEATTGDAFDVRGWYHLLYRDLLRDNKVMDVGSGLGIDGITFAQHGAQMTFVDIVDSNLQLLQRLCSLLGLSNVEFCYMEDITSLSPLPVDYDVIWCQGSLIHAPFDTIRAETQELLNHLRTGGRWIELAYPKTRWIREGRIPFDRWGERTDGVGTPWAEWYDLEKLKAILSPAKFEVVLQLEFHNSDFIWFDLIRET